MTTGVMSGQARVIALLQDENERLRGERNRDAIAGQAALDEANNEIVRLRAALFEVIKRAVLDEGTTWKDTANEMAYIAKAALDRVQP